MSSDHAMQTFQTYDPTHGAYWREDADFRRRKFFAGEAFPIGDVPAETARRLVAARTIEFGRPSDKLALSAMERREAYEAAKATGTSVVPVAGAVETDSAQGNQGESDPSNKRGPSKKK